MNVKRATEIDRHNRRVLVQRLVSIIHDPSTKKEERERCLEKVQRLQRKAS